MRLIPHILDARRRNHLIERWQHILRVACKNDINNVGHKFSVDSRQVMRHVLEEHDLGSTVLPHHHINNFRTIVLHCLKNEVSFRMARF